MIKNKIVVAALIVFVACVFVARARADDVVSQPDFSSSESQYWGSYAAAIGIASGTVSEFGTTTAALGDFMRAYLGWECDMRVEDNGSPYWCGHYIPLAVASTTMLGTSTRAYVFQNPHQAVDGDIQLFYVDYYGGNPAYMGFGTPANTTPNLSWAWTCGPYCRNGGPLGGTSNYFVPYFEMGPQADPPVISFLGQSVQGGAAIQEGGTVFGSSVSFSAILQSAANDPLILQVEVEPVGAPFTGVSTASSTAAVSAEMASVSVPDLADGGYRWAARAVDASTSESSPWAYFDPNGAIADFTVRAPKEPVVFIPGIVGTRLVRASDGKELWPDIGDMLLSSSDGYLDDFVLSPDGSQIVGKEMAASSIIDHESVLGISVPFYENTLRAFEADGYGPGTTLFAFPYDWRFGVKNAAVALANTIAAARAASLNGKISIIGYSMGGLVAKEYLAGLSDASFVDKLILVGAPQLGSPDAFKVLNYGDNLGFQIPVLNIDILNHGEVKKIAQNMPSIYDLLPSRAYVQDAGGYVQDFRNGGSSILDYDGTSRLMLENPADSRNSKLLAAADMFHGGIDVAPANAPDVYNIVGCSEPTISEYHIYDNGVIDVSRDAGDGTVPLVSAMDHADSFKNYFISGSKTGITHTSLVNDPRTIALISAILDGKEASFALPNGFSTALDSCFPSTSLPQKDSGQVGTAGGGSSVEFSAHGATGLTVQNDAGFSTGLNASGTVDFGIPDSTYEAIGNNYFITAPANGIYRLIAESSSSEDMVVKEKGYNGSSITQTATYVVSSTAPGEQGTDTSTTTATLDFSDFGSTGNLTVTESRNASSSDNAQNKSTTFSVAPTVESSSSDITPPEITTSGISASALQGSTTTIFFSASDTNSGVALLRATLNGVPVESGADVTFSQAGNNVFCVEAIDGAGNPTVKEIDFTVSTPLPPREVSFSPITDTYIDSNAPDVNYGGDAILRLRARGKNRALVKFDETAIENAIGSSTIVSAALTFAVAKNWENWASAESLALHRITSAWTEGGATWNTENPTSSVLWITEPSATTTISNDTTSTVSFNVTANIQAFLSGTENDGWILQKADECAPGVIDFGSREFGSPPALSLVLQ
jgi:pimeloyl-ACP methyl ester carboxylesterase